MKRPLPPDLAEALTREATRIYLRYAVEFVEAHKLCPWAVRARKEGETDVRICLEDEAAFEAPLAEIAAAGADLDRAVVLVVFPRLELGRRAFERFVAELRERDTARSPIGGPPMAMAAFHPDAEANFEAPLRLVPFIRRSPDPTIQLVRRSVLEELRGPDDHGTGYVDPTQVDITKFLTMPKPKPLHRRVAETNLETVQDVGVPALEETLAAIMRDRAESYGRLLSAR